MIAHRRGERGLRLRSCSEAEPRMGWSVAGGARRVTASTAGAATAPCRGDGLGGARWVTDARPGANASPQSMIGVLRPASPGARGQMLSGPL